MENTQISHAQQRSSRLLSLPAELRLRIYGFVIGSSRIHVVPTRQKKGYFICPDPHLTPCACHYNIKANGVYKSNNSTEALPRKPWVLWLEAPHLQPDAQRPSLSFLATCRQVHAEAAPILYADTEYVLHGVWSLSDMPHEMGTASVAQVRKLSLAFNFGLRLAIPGTRERGPRATALEPTPDTLWRLAWKDMPRHFPSVKVLSIWLEALDIEKVLDVDIGAWVEPLLCSRGLKLDRCSVRLTEWNGGEMKRREEMHALERRIEGMILGDSEGFGELQNETDKLWESHWPVEMNIHRWALIRPA